MFAAGKSASSKPLTYTFIGSTSSTLTTASISFGNFTLSNAGLAVVVVTSYGDTSRGVSSITIGGNSTTNVTTGNGTINAAIGYRSMSAGTHNVTLNLTGFRSLSTAGSIASVWLVENAMSLSPVDSGTLAPANNTFASVTLDYPAGGFSVYGFTLAGSGAVSWSSATDEVDSVITGTRQSHAFFHPTAAASNHTETVSSWSLTTSTMAGISFR